jgi:hypothetical protein
MYNKLDEHVMTSHDMDLLAFSGEGLNRRRGDRNRHDLPQSHWKFFWFNEAGQKKNDSPAAKRRLPIYRLTNNHAAFVIY